MDVGCKNCNVRLGALDGYFLNIYKPSRISILDEEFMMYGLDLHRSTFELQCKKCAFKTDVDEWLDEWLEKKENGEVEGKFKQLIESNFAGNFK